MLRLKSCQTHFDTMWKEGVEGWTSQNRTRVRLERAIVVIWQTDDRLVECCFLISMIRRENDLQAAANNLSERDCSSKMGDDAMEPHGFGWRKMTKVEAGWSWLKLSAGHDDQHNCILSDCSRGSMLVETIYKQWIFSFFNLPSKGAVELPCQVFDVHHLI